MKKEGKNFKLWSSRADLIGDSVMFLPVLNFLEKEFPNSYKIFPIMKKCSQAEPLFLGHPLIDRTHITDFDEGFGENDKKIFEECDFQIDVRPKHASEQWHNNRSMVEETWAMSGVGLNRFQEMEKRDKFPRLYKWFDVERVNKTVAIHCFAGYGRDNHRSPDVGWWRRTISNLEASGYKVIRLGHPSEPDLNTLVADLRESSFMDQVKAALGCDFYIGTDSGFSLVMGAYGHPQISLLTNWNNGHSSNPYCLAPMNHKGQNLNLFCDTQDGGCSGISQEALIDATRTLMAT